MSKAVYLELAYELTTECFLNTLKRFVSRRGLRSQGFSKIATNFRGASNELKLSIMLKNDKFKGYLQDNNITWNPHFEGLWEAWIKSAKFHLKRVLNNIPLTFEDFYTLLTQVEAVLNSRPLVPLSNDPSLGQALTAVPEDNLQARAAINHRARYRHICQMVQHFCFFIYFYTRFCVFLLRTLILCH